MLEQAAPGWYRDPYSRHELRFWDGRQWTQHVVSRGSQGIEPPTLDSRVPAVSVAAGRPAQQLRPADVATGPPVLDATLFTAAILVITQKTKMLEVNVGYRIEDQHGNQVATVREVAQSALRRIFSTQPDSRRPRVLQVVDLDGRVRLVLNRPSTRFRSKMSVCDPGGSELGWIVQKNLGIWKIHFGIESGGKLLGSINGEDWESTGFNIRDVAGNEIGRISKKQAGAGRQMFMKGEDYILEIHQHVDEPLRSLLIASLLAVDAALRRDQPGWELGLAQYRHQQRRRRSSRGYRNSA
jgi:uncharacterized protein YxjI